MGEAEAEKEDRAVSQELIQGIYRKLFRRFGPQKWWPGETAFEVAVGAVLTQNTSWSNASRAVRRLKEEKLLDPSRLSRAPKRRLAQLIRSSGYFNQKAGRLLSLSRFILRRYGGSMRQMRAAPAKRLREELLAIPGIGPETADSILLYALRKPVFVVDAYTRRILERHDLIHRKAAYAEVQGLFQRVLQPEAPLFNEYHALIVAAGKELCRPTNPRCPECPLRRVGNPLFYKHNP